MYIILIKNFMQNKFLCKKNLEIKKLKYIFSLKSNIRYKLYNTLIYLN